MAEIIFDLLGYDILIEILRISKNEAKLIVKECEEVSSVGELLPRIR